MIYLIDIEPDTDGSLLATCKAFPELTTFGKDKAQVWKNALGALEEAIAARIDDGDPLPAPATEAQIKRHKGVWVKLPLMTALKCMLYSALRESGMNRAELARRLDWHRESVDRLFRLDHASRVDQIEAAFKVLQQDVDVRVTRKRGTAVA
jgi:antitoxin HicB